MLTESTLATFKNDAKDSIECAQCADNQWRSFGRCSDRSRLREGIGKHLELGKVSATTAISAMTHSSVAETRMRQGDDRCRVSCDVGQADVELHWSDSIEVLEAAALRPWRELRSELADQRRDVDTERQD
jgi:hypothetical protein